MKPCKRKHILYLIIAISSILSIGRAQEAAVDSFRLQRDLRIMENILDRLLDDGRNPLHNSSESRGMYIEGYGMIFYTTQYQPLNDVVISTFQENWDRMQTRQSILKSQSDTVHPGVSESQTPMSDVLTAKVKAEEKRTLENIKTGILEFLLNYAPSSSQLSDSDRIALLVNLNGWRTLDPSNRYVFAWIHQGEALKHRANRTELSDKLLNVVNFEMTKTPDQMQRNITILSEIMDEAMATCPTPRHASTSGIYIKDLGALYFMDLHDNFWINNMDTTFSIVWQNNLSGTGINVVTQGTSKQNKKSEPLLQDELLDLLASYGHTVQLKPEEQIILDVNRGPQINFLMQSSVRPSHHRIQIRKKDLNDYSNGRISLNQLRQKAYFHSS